MLAAQLTAFGWPPQIEVREVPDPAPAPGEVVVALRAAAVNRRDLWVARYHGYCPLPVTLGSDGAGTVVAVGDGVTQVRVGAEVVIDPTLGWGPHEDWPGPAFDILGAPTPGTFAEMVAVPADNVHPRPPRLSWAEAAALNLGGLTAWRAVTLCAASAPGTSLVITGAGGGVATFAIQIAAALGATVWVTAGDALKIDRAVGLGAAGGVSYREPDWAAALIDRAGGPVDAVIDSYGAPVWAEAFKVLRPGGRLVSFGDTGGGSATVAVDDIYWQWRSIVGTSMGSPRDFAALLSHVVRSTWRPIIDRSHPLEAVGAALAEVEDPSRFGKIVIDVALPSRRAQG